MAPGVFGGNHGHGVAPLAQPDVGEVVVHRPPGAHVADVAQADPGLERVEGDRGVTQPALGHRGEILEGVRVRQRRRDPAPAQPDEQALLLEQRLERPRRIRGHVAPDQGGRVAPREDRRLPGPALGEARHPELRVERNQDGARSMHRSPLRERPAQESAEGGGGRPDQRVGGRIRIAQPHAVDKHHQDPHRQHDITNRGAAVPRAWRTIQRAGRDRNGDPRTTNRHGRPAAAEIPIRGVAAIGGGRRSRRATYRRPVTRSARLCASVMPIA